MLVAPRHPLAPRTPDHIGLSSAVLAQGGTPDELFARWRAFIKDTDVICSWGRYATSLFASSGGYLPPTRVDLRHVARELVARKVGTLEEFGASLDAPPSPPLTSGRAGKRLAEIVRIARYLGESPNPPEATFAGAPRATAPTASAPNLAPPPAPRAP